MKLSVILRVEELDARVVPAATGLPTQIVVDPLPNAIFVNPASESLPPAQIAGLPATFGSEAALRQYLIDQAVQQYAQAFGQRQYYWYGYHAYEYPGYGMGMRLESSPVNLGLADASFSQTNTQVQGVAEGDFVETDGQYLYVLAQNRLTILDARAPSDLKIISETEFTGNVVAEYLNGDHLTVVSQDNGYTGNGYPIGIMRPLQIWTLPAVQVQAAKPTVTVTVFDISDRSTPKLAQRTTLDGSYSDSRAIGDNVYVAVTNSFALPAPEYTTDGDATVYESADAYRARMEALPLEQLLPHYTSRWEQADGFHEQTGPLSTPEQIYQPAEAGDSQLFTILSFDVSGNAAGPTHSVSLVTPANTTLYAAPENFYLMTNRWDGSGQSTQIEKLSLSAGGMKLTAMGQVPGAILNRFSVSENGSYFCIATTAGWGQAARNNVYVLSQQDQALNIVGRLENLAPGESIYSVRFVGELGFVSTYVHIDPLFAIDLSDPSAPKVAGQLEVAGYSDYLQMIDATHLIGIGRDVQPGAWEPDGVQVSLYDVANPNNPTLLSRYVVPGDFSLSSAAEHDPHALTYDAASHTLVLPVGEFGTASQVVFDMGRYVSASQMVFQVVTATGTLELKGEFADPLPAQTELASTSVYSAGVQRNVIIGNMLYSISNNSVQVHSLDDLGTLVAQVSLADPNSTPYPEIWEPIDISNNGSGGSGASLPLIFVDAGLDPTSSAKDKSPVSAESPSATVGHEPTIGAFDPSFIGGVLVN